MKKLRSILSLLLAILILATPINSFSQEIDYVYIQQVVGIVNKQYVKSLSPKDLEENMLKGLLSNLDPYSRYYNKTEFESFLNEISGNFIGIGLYIKKEPNRVIVSDVVKGLPADIWGVKKGDEILSIDFKNVQNLELSAISQMIVGKAGTIVRLDILRKGEPLTFRIKRSAISINPVSYSILKDEIGYIQLKDFNAQAFTKMIEALNYLESKKVEKLILDLRNNPGGYLDKAVDISALFVPAGPVTKIKDRAGDEQVYYAHGPATKLNMVVLINEYSASAAEILAAAIKDTGVGYLLGNITYGKGTVQNIIRLPRGDGLKITAAEYYSPKGIKINGVGVIPHEIIENRNFDLQLEKAIEHLKSSR